MSKNPDSADAVQDAAAALTDMLKHRRTMAEQAAANAARVSSETNQAGVHRRGELPGDSVVHGQSGDLMYVAGVGWVYRQR